MLFCGHVSCQFRSAFYPWRFRPVISDTVRKSSGHRQVLSDGKCPVGLLNLVIGYILFRAGKIATAKIANLVVFFAGILLISVMLSHAFAKIPR